ncbi:hypothetical protein L207DRAFT_518617 [Hyaloscypha variabilis F]|jgi:hypothetical protein|uniref:Glyoxalase-like domain-containing protein n=1 Tax=Hyaloscypha variabilis (strain UAMH 11265 / GT02V1 / F) TaxID=1149755 RepID=A0A2J6R2P4_HYAVF|nr:hypothetical protein L207DRAFT_518617 [Hyaloscypha variabilis F]
MPPIYLDHIVILLPYSQIVSPPASITKNFTITPGGVHAGGQTENKLIVFEDGSYIELIAFVHDDPKHRVGHRWGGKEVGIIDFALSSEESAESCFEGVKERLEKKGVEVRYEKPAEGGRKRDDGEVLKWKVTVPEHPATRGEVPFFCHDITGRELRVPGEKQWTAHPSKAYGVRGLKIYVEKERVEVLERAYPAILDVEYGERGGKSVFEIGSLRPVEGQGKAVLSVLEPTGEGERKLGAERGVFLTDLEIGISGSSNEEGQTIRFPIALGG